VARRLRILTWHVHGNYLYYLTQVPHDFYLVTDDARSVHHAGRSGTLPWGNNVMELPAEQVAATPIDVVLFQSRDAWEDEQHRVLSEAQRRGPRIYVEHDPPQAHPTDQRHWVDDPGVLLVHVTPYNALMWDSGRTPVKVIEHGVKLLAGARYDGRADTGIVVVNNLRRRGRRLGLDVYLQMREQVPLDLVGLGSENVPGGKGSVPNADLPALMSGYRYFFNPIRYTSLGLSIVEAMMVGMPIVGLATTELSTVIQSGVNGFVDTRTDRLVEWMQLLRKDRQLAVALGTAARITAVDRFGIDRFVADWLVALSAVSR